jgi:hypothetical protein
MRTFDPQPILLRFPYAVFVLERHIEFCEFWIWLVHEIDLLLEKN